MITEIIIGKKVMHVAVYNPSDAISNLYCRFLVHQIAKSMENVTVEEVHNWLRENCNKCDSILNEAEGGTELPRLTKIGEYPVPPGEEAEHRELITVLKTKRQIKDRRANR